MLYYINYHTGAGNKFFRGSLDDAKRAADAGATYTQQVITIHPVKIGDINSNPEDIIYSEGVYGFVDDNGTRHIVGSEILQRDWCGIAPDDDAKTLDIIPFGDRGFYDEWIEM